MRKTGQKYLIFASALVLLTGFVTVVADEEKSDKEKQAAKYETKTLPTGTSQKPEASPYEAATRAAKPQAGAGDTVVITNEYLQKMMSGLTDEQKLSGVYQAERHIGDPAPASGATGDPAPGAGAGAASAPSSEQPRSVDELNGQIQNLERRLLALKNPLLPRRYSDKTNDEDEEWDEKSHQQQIASTEQQLADARAELAEAQKSGSR